MAERNRIERVQRLDSINEIIEESGTMHEMLQTREENKKEQEVLVAMQTLRAYRQKADETRKIQEEESKRQRRNGPGIQHAASLLRTPTNEGDQVLPEEESKRQSSDLDEQFAGNSPKVNEELKAPLMVAQTIKKPSNQIAPPIVTAMERIIVPLSNPFNDM